MTKILRIDPDGTVSRVPGDDLLGVARAAFDGMTSVFTCHPITDGPDGEFPNFASPIIGVCHDYAYQATPTVNPKAWSLYGRSPIAGPVFIAHDDRTPFVEAFIAVLETQFVRRPIMRTDMMRATAATSGLSWPEEIHEPST